MSAIDKEAGRAIVRFDACAIERWLEENRGRPDCETQPFVRLLGEVRRYPKRQYGGWIDEVFIAGKPPRKHFFPDGVVCKDGPDELPLSLCVVVR